MGRRDAVRLLLPLLDHAAPGVYQGALRGLGTLTETGFRPGEQAAVARELVTRLRPDLYLVVVAKKVLAGSAEALPGMRELVDRTSSPILRAAALSLLDPHKATDADTPHDLPLFVRHLDDTDRWVSMAAAAGLAHSVQETGTLPVDEERVRARLAVLASDPAGPVREAATEAIRVLEDHRNS
ncbi:hypothetical protein [Streptomyces sp. NPDC088794]|uniref:hypothetical protein n=1 Tax=Streptomyces sp. NPDC088794 TaxID=3365902 RepID=UPI00380130B7